MSHNLYLPQELGEVRAAIGGQARHSPMSSLDDEPAARERRTPESPRASATAYTSQAVLAPGSDSVPSERVRALSAELAELRAEVARLRERVSELEAKLTT